ncbi:hypothetical protein BD626DRAFT_487248 [Schizophyllum amplum]|uniref:Uncharacterized protein n=1 Tax=Schizophyllum amplum TaxID=97359 RepID=A0A550CNC2_9AGAR|nr:hypothetical protein BD626DRAFT_487248 [Auriculariopsis ampla]
MSIHTLGMYDVSPAMQNLKDQLAGKESRIAAQESRILKQSEAMDELKRRLDEALYNLGRQSGKALELESILEQRLGDLTSERLARENAQVALAHAQEDIKAKSAEARELQSTLDTLSCRFDVHDARSLKLENELKTAQARVKTLETDLRHLSSVPPPSVTPGRKAARPRSSSMTNFRITTLEQEVADTRQTLAIRDSELRAASEKLAKTEADLLKSDNERVAVSQRLQTEVTDLRSKLDDQHDELEFLRSQQGDSSREEELLKRIDEDDAKIATLEMLVGDAHEVPKLKEKLRSVERKLRAEEERNMDCEGRNIELVREKEEALDELDDARDHVATLEMAIKEKESQIAALQQDRKTRRSLSSSASSRVPDDTVANVERMLHAIDRLRGERDNLRRDLNFLETETRFTIESLEARVQSQYNASDSCQDKDEIRRLRTASTAFAVIITNLTADADSSAFQLDHLRMQLKEREDAYSQLEMQHELTQQSLEETAGYRDSLTVELENLSDRSLESTESERASLAARVSELVVELASAQHAQSCEPTSPELRESRDEVSRLQQEVSELSKALESVESECSSLNLQVTNLTAEVEEAQQELSTAETRYSELQFHQLSNMTQNEATRALRTQIEELEGRVMRRTEQIGIQQHDIRKLETNLTLQEERMTDVMAEIETLEAQKNAMVEDCADAREQRDEAIARSEQLECDLESLEEQLASRDVEAEVLVDVIFKGIARLREPRNILSISDGSLETEEALDAARDATVALAVSQTSWHRQSDVIRGLHSDIEQLHLKVEELEQALEEKSAELQNLQEIADTVDASSTAQTMELQAQVVELERTIDDMKASHAKAIDGLRQSEVALQQQVDELRASASTTEDLQGQLVQLKVKHIEELGQLNAKVVEQASAHEEALARVEAAERRAVLRDLCAQESELQAQYDTAKDALAELEHRFQTTDEEAQAVQQVVEKLENELLRTRNDHRETMDQQERAVVQMRTQLEQSLQAALRDTDGARQLLSNECDKRMELEETLSRMQQQLVDEANQWKAEQDQLMLEHGQLAEEFDQVQADLTSAREEIASLQQSKEALEFSMSDLEAEVQRSISLNRYLEGQMKDTERKLNAHKRELDSLTASLSEKTSELNKVNIDLSLERAGQQREIAALRHDIEALRSKPDMEAALAELEERNVEMEEMLRKKCAEIESNDDRALEMMKENKKLTSKVESLTRKVQNLQAKLAAAKAVSQAAEATSDAPPASVAAPQPPRSSSISPQPTMPTSRSLNSSVSSTFSHRLLSGAGSSHAPPPSTSRPRLAASTTQAPPTFSDTPPTVRSQSSRIVSQPPAFSRPKTPEQRASPHPVPAAMPVSASHSKKRGVPEDFESHESHVPRAVVADATIANGSEERPIRRIPSQGSFTPVRHQTSRPMISLSPKKTAEKLGAYIADVTNTSPNRRARNVTAPTQPVFEAAEKPVKRGWLGKMRGTTPASRRPYDAI